MTFYHQLRSVQQKNNSLLCIGLDTDPSKIPKSLLKSANPILEFNKCIIDTTQDLVCAYKLNLAFYESLGEAGWNAVHATLASIPADVITIGDAKRGDIGNTAELYAKSLFEDYGFGACTVNPYMGFDSVEPFINDERRGAFILALTSNPGAQDFQYLKADGKPLYEHVIAKATMWNTRENCGLVVGATRPEALQHIRRIVPDMPLLIPGIGAQGGDLEAAIRFGCDRNGEMAIINASRSIIYASHGNDFGEAARGAAVTIRAQINKYREKAA